MTRHGTHMQVIFRVEVAKLHPAEELAEGKIPIAIRVAQLEVPRHLVLGVLTTFSDKVLLQDKIMQKEVAHRITPRAEKER